MVNKPKSTTTTTKVVVKPAKIKSRATRPRRRRTRRTQMKRQPAMSQDGLAFLKCAYASLDFEASQAHGVPDQYQGKSITSDNATNIAITPSANADTYIVVLPTPGVAYWTTTVNPSGPLLQTAVWTPVYDKSFTAAGLFGLPTNQAAVPPADPVDRAGSVTKFRYVSNSLEITSTSALNTTSGSITIWKGDVSLSVGVQNTATASTCEYNLNGMDFLTSVPRKHYTGHVKDGAYVLATNNDVDFEWTQILSGVTRIPSIGDSSASNSPTFGAWNGDIVGFGSMQAICARISATAAVSVVLDARSCIEYQPNTNSIIDQYCGTSANYDPVALQAYRNIAKSLPIAVPRKDNDGFWDDRVKPALTRFLSIVKTSGEVAGMAAGFLGLMI